MNANYSEALEQQLALSRWLADDHNYITEAVHRRTPLAEIIGQDRERPLIDDTTLRYARLTIDEGAPYYWDPKLCDVLEAAAPTLPNISVTSDVLPTRAGFMWFGRPLSLPMLTGQPTARLAALGWCMSPHEQHVIVSSFWHVNRWYGVPVVFNAWTLGQPWSQIQDRYRARYSGSLATETSRQRVKRIFEYFGTALAFLNQRLIITEKKQVHRRVHDSVVAGGWRHEPLVRVVRLRRRHSAGEVGASGHHSHEWQCQWLVRGHWRQQPYPKAGEVRPKWITPYVKGPDDKPLKPPRATVFAVVR